MALTAIEKAANKAAKSIRDAAYRARRREYLSARERAEQSPAVLAAEAKAAELAQVQEEAIAKREEKRQALRDQIRALEAQIDALRDDPAVELAHRAVAAAYTARNALKDGALEVVEKTFADMQGAASWGVGGWSVPRDVRERMDAARQAVIEGQTCG